MGNDPVTVARGLGELELTSQRRSHHGITVKSSKTIDSREGGERIFLCASFDFQRGDRECVNPTVLPPQCKVGIFSEQQGHFQ